MNLLLRPIRWLLEPARFLAIRVIADFAGGAWGMYFGRDDPLGGAFLFGAWLTFVGVVTLAAERIASAERKKLTI